MSKIDAIAYASIVAKEINQTVWVYLVGGRGDRCQLTTTKNVTTNGKWIPDNRIVAEVSAK